MFTFSDRKQQLQKKIEKERYMKKQRDGGTCFHFNRKSHFILKITCQIFHVQYLCNISANTFSKRRHNLSSDQEKNERGRYTQKHRGWG